MIQYGFKKSLALTFDAAKEKVVESLLQEGFGIMAELDVGARLKEKLGVDFRKYIILGACNPSYAHRAILTEEDIGLLLPCNVLLYEKNNKTILAIIRPRVAMQMVNNEALRSLADDVEAKLEKVFDAVV